MTVRPFKPDDCDAIAQVFHAAVHGIDAQYYDARQREAWAPTPPDLSSWRRRLLRTKPLVAVGDGGRVVGFAELISSGLIDCFYVCPQQQNRGVGRVLLRAVFKDANLRGISPLKVDASHAAKAFFKANGFVPVRENCVERNGVLLRNTTMVRS